MDPDHSLADSDQHTQQQIDDSTIQQETSTEQTDVDASETSSTKPSATDINPEIQPTEVAQPPQSPPSDSANTNIISKNECELTSQSPANSSSISTSKSIIREYSIERPHKNQFGGLEYYVNTIWVEEYPPPDTIKEEKDTLVFIHGWPDSGNMYGSQVSRLNASGFKCVVVTLPAFKNEVKGQHDKEVKQRKDVENKNEPTFKFVVDSMIHVVQRVKNGKSGKVTLVAHDWGCIIAFMMMKQSPGLIQRVCCMDVGLGQYSQKTPFLQFFMSLYMIVLAILYRFRGRFADFVVRILASWLFKCPRKTSEISSTMGWPYYDALRSNTLHGLSTYVPQVPVLFFYGRKSPLRYFSREWAESISRNPDSHVVAIEGDHWFPVRKGTRDEVTVILHEWLTTKAVPVKAKVAL